MFSFLTYFKTYNYKDSFGVNRYFSFSTVSILYIVLCSLFIIVHPLKRHLGDMDITLVDTRLFIFITILLCTITYFYYLTHKLVTLKTFNKGLYVAIFCNILFLFIWPLTSRDIFTYIFQSRIITQFGQNPYIVNYNSFSTDIFFPTISNRAALETSQYGPLFLLTGAIISKISNNNLVLNVYLFKTLFVSANIANIFLIKKITNNYKSALLYAMNPFLLFEFAINGHNDVLMIFFCLLSLYYVSQKTNTKNVVLAFSILAISSTIKIFTALLVPLYLVYYIKNSPTLTAKIKIFLISFISYLMFFIIPYTYFWAGPTIFLQFINTLTFISIFASPFVTVSYIVYRNLGIDNYHLIGRITSQIIFILLYLSTNLIFFRTKNTQFEILLKNMVIVLIGFFFFWFNWLMPWYLTILITTFILYMGYSNDFSKTRFLWIITITSILPYFILR